MELKTKKQAINYILKRHLKNKENVLLCERLFIVNLILGWVFQTTNNQNVIIAYINDLEKYVVGDIELPWVTEVLNKNRKINIYDNKKSKKSKKPKKVGKRR